MSVVPSQNRAPVVGVPLGYKGQRGALLVELKKAPGLSARDLAARLALSLNAVRHHLKELAADGVVEYERVHHGVGAPGFAYRLTAAGELLFPRRYGEALVQLLEAVEARDGREAAVALLEAHVQALGRRLHEEAATLPPQERMAAVVRVRSEQGYMAEGQATHCCGTLTEHNCAMREVAERYPELCAAEIRVLGEALGGTIERRRHQLGGCGACEYKVRFEDTV